MGHDSSGMSSSPGLADTVSLNSFFSFSLDLFCVAGFDGYFKQLNPAWTPVLGWSTDELLKAPYLEFVHPDDRAKTMAAAADLTTRTDLTHFRNRYRCKSGDYRWLEWSARADQNQPQIFAAARDVTEEARKTESIRSLSQLVDTIRDPVFVLSPKENFRFIYVNDAAIRHYGAPRETLLRITVPEIDPEYDLPKLRATWEIIRKDGSMIVETIHRRHDGQIIPVQVNANYIMFEGEECIGGFIQDIRERKKNEDLQRELTEKLLRSNKNLKQFSAIVSHDLQQPLRTISAHLEFLQRKSLSCLDDDAKESLGFAITASKRLNSLIRDLLIYCHVEGKQKNEMVDSAEVVRVTLSQLEEAIRSAGARVHVGSLPVVKAKHSILSLVFQNLIENALKYCSDRAPQIFIVATERENHWIFSVKDNGIGISKDDTSRIFEAFQRAHAYSQYPGTGLGLATCKKIVESLGGAIWVESQIGEGSEFLFTLPK